MSSASLNAELPDAVERVAASVVAVVGARGAATAGFVWRPGVVVTSARAVWRARGVRIVRADGQSADAELRGIDPGTDVAAISIGAGDGVPLQPASDAEPRIGEFVFAVARDASGRASASFGHIGSVGGAWHSGLGSPIQRWIRLDGGLYPGFSGAPLADASGRVIGMASAAFERGFGIVLPLQTLEQVVPQLLAKGRVAQGYLGVSAQPVSLPGDTGRGLIVTALASDGPGAAAGLLLGDVIVAVAGRPVATLEALRAALAERIGAPLELSLLRAGQPHTLSVTPGERQAAPSCH